MKIQDCCEGCGQYRILIKRKEDGKLLCKKCSKNKCIKMFKEKDKLEEFYNFIENYIWKCGKWMSNGIFREINEMEVSKFADAVDSEYLRLKKKKYKEKSK